MEIAYIAAVSTVILIAISLIYWTVRNGISPMPSSFIARRLILSLIDDLAVAIENESGERIQDPRRTALSPTLLEPGSGWGTLSVPLARRLPTWSVCGYESSPVPYLFSRLYSWWLGCSNLALIRKDFTDVRFSSAKIIVCYLFPEGMQTIKEKVVNEFRGTPVYIISNTFGVSGWKPVKTITADNIFRTKIYLYNPTPEVMKHRRSCLD